MSIENIAFIALFVTAVTLFTLKIREIIANIRMGQAIDRSGNASERWKTMLLVAFGQKKMFSRPLPAVLHLAVYVGFVIINIELLEIIIDGATGSHRALSFLGGFYNLLIASFEVLAFLVIVACVIFLARRNIVKVARFHYREMTSFPKSDANLILIAEVLMMSAFLIMNASDLILQGRGVEHFTVAGAFPISQFLVPMMDGMSEGALVLLERACWWFHIIGIFALLNYLPYSKHFHIVLAFPNTYFSNLSAKGRLTNPESVTREVKLMFDPTADPYAAPADTNGAVQRFGAKDVPDLTWKQLLDAYTCTECGRCSSSCPANQTGKLLSPRKIMMDTRDRMEEIRTNIKKHGQDHNDGKSLLGDYITAEEIWACTSCNACVQECPVNIDPLGIIIDLRRYLVMEESKAPTELAGMFTNIENNGAPWQFSPADRINWANETN
ncbi:MAG TPA: (Fe-S)-binding protein [Flavobacteriales bacterium]|mgnify:CR=1 FL=1|nr:(Fe-S)-binding protein [Flavobacteriales bacterium]HRE98654.1 (Fe-S)-binding protein [Flavobacteriales bacterium]HRJ36612.1 (Fe-S)-binding protein [Flavobacteriales bacterium]HRJ40065.1 (Fe-S)-binding protein [Flavobacteriales bacterium]